MPIVQSSGTQTVTVTETTLAAAITGNINLGGCIDLTNMTGLLLVRVYKKAVSGGADVLFREYSVPVKPSAPAELLLEIEPVPAPYGCTVKVLRIGGSDWSAGYSLYGV